MVDVIDTRLMHTLIFWLISTVSIFIPFLFYGLFAKNSNRHKLIGSINYWISFILIFLFNTASIFIVIPMLFS